MAYSTDWNVDEYRNDDESEEQWELRSSFMEKWKGNFPEDRLVCLAKVFANIEFLGCRYPAEVMKLVADLSKEVAIGYRESKKKKLQRTFVSASDAAEDRAKGTKKINHVPVEQTNPSKYKKFVAATPDPTPTNQGASTSKAKSEIPSKYAINKNSNWHIANSDNDNESVGSSRAINSNNYDRKRSHNSQFQQNSNNPSKNQFDLRQNKNTTMNKSIGLTEYGWLVLFDRPGNFSHKLFASCQRSKVEILADYSRAGDNWICSIKVNNVDVCSATAQIQKDSKEAASQEAWKEIQKVCHTVVIKKNHSENDECKISAKEVDQDEGAVRLTDGLETKVDSAIATRMMKLMGWSGGSLGAAADGISEPIQPNLKQIRRQGLGNAASGRSIREALMQTIHEYAQSVTAEHDLVFANDFSKEERAAMHKIAQKRGLKSKSYGKDEDRYLVISRNMSPYQLVENLLDSGGSNEKYELVLPGTVT